MSRTLEKQRFAVVCLSLAWCTLLIIYRMITEYDWLERGLLWNLFLAAIPLFWSAAFQWANETRRPGFSVIFFATWLIFFPNAPYLLTDLIHLITRAGAQQYYILAMLLSCAGTGTLLGYLSLLRIHSEVEKLFNKTAGWLVVGGSLLLCGFGIYVGRFLRWNSWNAVTSPLEVVKDVVTHMLYPSPHPNPLLVSLIVGTGLLIGYLAVRVTAQESP